MSLRVLCAFAESTSLATSTHADVGWTNERKDESNGNKTKYQQQKTLIKKMKEKSRKKKEI